MRVPLGRVVAHVDEVAQAIPAAGPGAGVSRDAAQDDVPRDGHAQGAARELNGASGLAVDGVVREDHSGAAVPRSEAHAQAGGNDRVVHHNQIDALALVIVAVEATTLGLIFSPSGVFVLQSSNIAVS